MAVISAIIVVPLAIVIATVDREPKPIMATDEMSAVCCSEERMISIYEETESLQESYDLVMEAIANKDTVNLNAVHIKQLWEDSLRRQDLRGMSTAPILSD
ncbi:MAG: hypothetical protein P8J32_01560 [bacterium]|nr:hypothetical protein [bacterium]